MNMMPHLATLMNEYRAPSGVISVIYWNNEYKSYCNSCLMWSHFEFCFKSTLICFYYFWLRATLVPKELKEHVVYLLRLWFSNNSDKLETLCSISKRIDPHKISALIYWKYLKLLAKCFLQNSQILQLLDLL